MTESDRNKVKTGSLLVEKETGDGLFGWFPTAPTEVRTVLSPRFIFDDYFQ